jgi:hypothetical protein
VRLHIHANLKDFHRSHRFSLAAAVHSRRKHATRLASNCHFSDVVCTDTAGARSRKLWIPFKDTRTVTLFRNFRKAQESVNAVA